MPMWSSLVAAFALMLVLEGLLPFLAPAKWRATFKRILEFNDGQIRFFGMTSMVAGVILLFLLTLF